MEKLDPNKDYPAAHSMDTTWFAVDELGEIGVFDSYEDGSVPKYNDGRPLDGRAHLEPQSVPTYDEYEDSELAFLNRHLDLFLDLNELSTGLAPKKIEVIEDDFVFLPELVLFKKDREIPDSAKHEFRVRTSDGWGFLLDEYWRCTDHDILSHHDIGHIYNSWVDAGVLKAIWHYILSGNQDYQDVSSYFGVYSYLKWGPGIYPYVPSRAPGCYVAKKNWPDSNNRKKPFIQLKDFAFRDGENFEPFEHFTDIVSDSGNHFYTLSSSRVYIPKLQANWTSQDFDLMMIGDYKDKWHEVAFIDAQGYLAIASIPTSHLDSLAAPLSKSDLRANQLFADPRIGTRWGRKIPIPTSRLQNWLEYPYHAHPPASLGFYHYTMAWHHAGPYIKIATPHKPLHIDSISDALREYLNPTHLPDVDFTRDKFIQPFEHIDCTTDAEIWVDAKLENAHAVPGKSPDLNPGRVDRLLRQARKHYALVDSLGRNVKKQS